MTDSFLPSLPVCVGVTGHRRIPAELIPHLESELDASFQTVSRTAEEVSSHYRRSAGLFAKAPTLSVASCLSEGSDRFVAKAGLRNGFSLQGVLPFSRKSGYTPGDLSPEDLKAAEAELDDLCARATSVLELDRDPPQYWEKLDRETADINSPSDVSEAFRQEAYAEANSEMLDRIDVLFALWNGKPQSNRASTFAVMLRALQRGIPVVVFSLAKAQPARLVLKEDELFAAGQNAGSCHEGLSEALKQSLQLNDENIEGLKQLFADVREAHQDEMPAASGYWKTFQKWLTKKEAKQVPSAPYRPCDDKVFEAFDSAANAYADTQRSAFLWVAIFSILAVALSAISVALPPGGTVKTVGVAVLKFLQASCLLAVMRLFFVTKKAGWKVKLTRIRYIAEVLRLYEFNRSVGIGRFWHDDRTFAQATNDNDSEKYIDWFIRMRCRLWGTMSVDLADKAELEAAKQNVLDYLVASQRGYHELNSVRCQVMNGKINRMATAVFYYTFAFVVANIVISLFGAPLWLTITLGFIATIAPVIASTSRAVAQRAELGRLALRSSRMVDELSKEEAVLKATKDGRGLRVNTARIFKILLSDTEDWKGLYRIANIAL